MNYLYHLYMEFLAEHGIPELFGNITYYVIPFCIAAAAFLVVVFFLLVVVSSSTVVSVVEAVVDSSVVVVVWSVGEITTIETGFSFPKPTWITPKPQSTEVTTASTVSVAAIVSNIILTFKNLSKKMHLLRLIMKINCLKSL